MVAGTALGFLLNEATYRAYHDNILAPERFVRPAANGFAVNDERYGRRQAIPIHDRASYTVECVSAEKIEILKTLNAGLLTCRAKPEVFA